MPQPAHVATSVGNFHLLPVAHVPPPLQPSATQAAPSSEIDATPEPNCGQGSASPARDLPRAVGDCDRWHAQPPSPQDYFFSGAVAGVALCLLSAWLVVARKWGSQFSMTFCSWLDGAGRSGACSREDAEISPDAGKVRERRIAFHTYKERRFPCAGT